MVSDLHGLRDAEFLGLGTSRVGRRLAGAKESYRAHDDPVPGKEYNGQFNVLSVFSSAFVAPEASSQTAGKTFLRPLFHHLAQQTARPGRT